MSYWSLLVHFPYTESSCFLFSGRMYIHKTVYTTLKTYTLHLRGGIQNIPDWCRQLYSSFGIAKHRFKQAKLWIPGYTATFCSDYVKTSEDVASNFGENRPGCLIMTPPGLTRPSSSSSFRRNTKRLLSPTHRTPLIWHPVTSSYFQKWNWSWNDAGLIPLSRSRPNRSVLDTLIEKDFQEAFQKWRRRWDRVYKCGRKLIRGWWWPIDVMASFMIFTASVRNILDTLS
jgi:hypothetical protein